MDPLLRQAEQLAHYWQDFPNAAELTVIGPLMENDRVLTSDPATPVIFLDGGSRHWTSFGLRVGDGDSHGGELDIQLPQEKDVSDLGFVLRNTPQTITTVDLLGFSGGRLDHELMNIGEALSFVGDRSRARVHIGGHLAVLSAGRWHFNYSGLFSLLSPTANEVHLLGDVAYPCDPPIAVQGLESRTLSNRARGDCDMTIHRPIVLFTEGLGLTLEP